MSENRDDEKDPRLDNPWDTAINEEGIVCYGGNQTVTGCAVGRGAKIVVVRADQQRG